MGTLSNNFTDARYRDIFPFGVGKVVKGQWIYGLDDWTLELGTRVANSEPKADLRSFEQELQLQSEESMSELIWKVKQLFRKIIPIALIAGLCYAGFTAYQKGWLGRKLTHQITSLTYKIPFFGSKFSTGAFRSNSPSSRSSYGVSHASKKRAHKKHHRRRHSRHGRHRARH